MPNHTRDALPWRARDRAALSQAEETPRFAVGDAIYSGQSRGTVVSVDETHGTVSVEWLGGDYGPIKYPIDATYLRGALPWET